MIGFEDDGPVPAAVAVERSDGGPPTERVEMVPLVEAPHYERVSRLKRGTCLKDPLVTEIYVLAARLERLCDEYHDKEPWDKCPCEECKQAGISSEFFHYMSFQAQLIKDEADGILHPEVRRVAVCRVDAMDDDYAKRGDAAEAARQVRILANCQGVPKGIREAFLGIAYTLDTIWAG